MYFKFLFIDNIVPEDVPVATEPYALKTNQKFTHSCIFVYVFLFLCDRTEASRHARGHRQVLFLSEISFVIFAL